MMFYLEPKAKAAAVIERNVPRVVVWECSYKSYIFLQMVDGILSPSTSRLSYCDASLAPSSRGTTAPKAGMYSMTL